MNFSTAALAIVVLALVPSTSAFDPTGSHHGKPIHSWTGDEYLNSISNASPRYLTKPKIASLWNSAADANNVLHTLDGACPITSSAAVYMSKLEGARTRTYSKHNGSSSYSVFCRKPRSQTTTTTALFDCMNTIDVPLLNIAPKSNQSTNNGLVPTAFLPNMTRKNGSNEDHIENYVSKASIVLTDVPGMSCDYLSRINIDPASLHQSYIQHALSPLLGPGLTIRRRNSLFKEEVQKTTATKSHSRPVYTAINTKKPVQSPGKDSKYQKKTTQSTVSDGMRSTRNQALELEAFLKSMSSETKTDDSGSKTISLSRGTLPQRVSPSPSSDSIKPQLSTPTRLNVSEGGSCTEMQAVELESFLKSMSSETKTDESGSKTISLGTGIITKPVSLLQKSDNVKTHLTTTTHSTASEGISRTQQQALDLEKFLKSMSSETHQSSTKPTSSFWNSNNISSHMPTTIQSTASESISRSDTKPSSAETISSTTTQSTVPQGISRTQQQALELEMFLKSMSNDSKPTSTESKTSKSNSHDIAPWGLKPISQASKNSMHVQNSNSGYLNGINGQQPNNPACMGETDISSSTDPKLRWKAIASRGPSTATHKSPIQEKKVDSNESRSILGSLDSSVRADHSSIQRVERETFPPPQRRNGFTGSSNNVPKSPSSFQGGSTGSHTNANPRADQNPNLNPNSNTIPEGNLHPNPHLNPQSQPDNSPSNSPPSPSYRSAGEYLNSIGKLSSEKPERLSSKGMAVPDVDALTDPKHRWRKEHQKMSTDPGAGMAKPEVDIHHEQPAIYCEKKDDHFIGVTDVPWNNDWCMSILAGYLKR